MENKISSFHLISEDLIDSVIKTLSTSEKIDLLVQSDLVFINGSFRQDGLSKSLSPNIVSDNNLDTSNNDKCTNQFNLIDYHSLCKLNSISDTSFLIKFLTCNPIFGKEQSQILSIRLDTSFFMQCSDTAFLQFNLDRYEPIKEEFRMLNRLIGFGLNQKQFTILSGKLSGNDSIFMSFFNLFIQNSDVFFIDSVSNFQELPVGINGLLVVKPLNMKVNEEQKCLEFMKSAADMILLDSAKSKTFKSAYEGLLHRGEIKQNELDIKIRKTLKAKIWSGRKHNKIGEKEQGYSENYYHHRFVQKSVVLVNNPDSLIPIKELYKKQFHILFIGSKVNNDFIQTCNKYIQSYSVVFEPGSRNQKLVKLGGQNFYIYVIDKMLTDSSEINRLDEQIEKSGPKSSVIINFGPPKNLTFLPGSIPLIQVFTNSIEDYKYAAQAIFGGTALDGQLPYTINREYLFGLKNITSKTRFKYGIPEEVDMDENKLIEIDKIVQSAISSGAFPGCQVFVAKGGQVIYDKSFGYHSYAKDCAVDGNDLYDLASVTKIAATTIAAMKMVSDGKISLNDPLGKFFRDTRIDYSRIKPDTVVEIDTFSISSVKNWKSFIEGRDTVNLDDSTFITIDTVIYKLTPRLNIFKVPLIDLLKHQSGIAPALPVFRYMYYKLYYLKQIKMQHNAISLKSWFSSEFNGMDLPQEFPENINISDSVKKEINKGISKLYAEYFSTKEVKDSSDIRLTDNLYLRNKYFDTIWHDTRQLPVYNRKLFIYSDINMILLQFAMDTLNQQSVDYFMKKNFYQPLGLRNISYVPLHYYPRRKIVPTEMEKVWRHGYLHGYVHDPSAALLGGIAGNAGLFSSARDLGVLFQMVLNKGTYGGIRFIRPKVIDQFTRRFDETQRALGFDMPNRKAKLGTKASINTYGHSGYTGTCVWVDPDSELIYVFLSNRNNPNANNWRINSLKIREKIHDAIYDAMIKK